MPPIDDDTVRHLARLARLRLTDDERGRLRGELESLLEHFAELKSVDTSTVEPSFHTIDATPLRSDEPRCDVDAEALHGGAPRWVEGAFAVPKVLE